MMIFHDILAGVAPAGKGAVASSRSVRFSSAGRALMALAALGLLAAGCASATRSTALVSPISSATLVDEASPIYRAVSVGEVTGGEETTLISKSKVSNAAFENALETSLDLMGALAGDEKFIIHAQIEEVAQPNLQINFTADARVKYRVVSAEDGSALYITTVGSSGRVKFTESVVREERIRLATEAATRENLKIFLRNFVAHTRSNPAGYQSVAAGS